ncbi:MAG: MarR family winged helix-turn-helix transcriptional regulator [Tropicimonas sp.]|uniref:MarR family winged helix-turn-helix transcriptional regulator n=1 Tax=Tropicimonas sp. TaxID=2067044 RepID=UPI003A84EF53
MILRKHDLLLQDSRARDDGTDVDAMELCFELLSLAGAIDRDCAARLRPHRLSEGKFVILSLLRDRPRGLPPHELADGAGVTRATITGLIDGLERDGLLRRVPDKADRRSISVRLTPQGAALAADLGGAHTAWIATLTGDLTMEERKMLRKLLRRIWMRTDAGRAAEPVS